MAADSSTSAQRRRATKPLIEKRRRARINSSLAQLKEIVARPTSKTQETRSNRLEKADILEMTVDYVKRLHERSTVVDDSQKDVAITTDFESSFKDGYKLCMSEVQNYFFKNYQKQASESLSESLSHSLQNYLLQVYRKSLTSEEKVCQSGTFNELKASSCHKSSKMNSDLRTPSSNMNDNYELHSENSDLGFNYSSGLTDDEMTENYSNVDSKDNSEVIESYLLINSVSSVQDIPYNGDNNINPTDHVWRPW